MNKILHFNDGFSLNEILNYILDKKDILYYTRIINNEFHIIKYNEKSYFKMGILCSELLKFYEKSNLKDLLKDVKIKGNDNFAIINSNNIQLIDRLKNDLNKLLIK
jgi:hypothetical protein